MSAYLTYVVEIGLNLHAFGGFHVKDIINQICIHKWELKHDMTENKYLNFVVACFI